MKIVALTPEQVKEILEPPEFVPPKDWILRKLEQEWLTANKEGRAKDAAEHDKQHAAVLAAKTDKEATEAFERTRGRPFISKPRPTPRDPSTLIPPGHPPKPGPSPTGTEG